MEKIEKIRLGVDEIIIASDQIIGVVVKYRKKRVYVPLTLFNSSNTQYPKIVRERVRRALNKARIYFVLDR